jgi:hypothetical protein
MFICYTWFHLSFPSQTIRLCLQVNNLPYKSPICVGDRSDDILHSEQRLGTRPATTCCKVPPNAFPDNFVLFWLLPEQCDSWCKEGFKYCGITIVL